SAMAADVGQQAIARFDQPVLARNLPHRAYETCDLIGLGARGEIVPTDPLTLGYDENVHRRLRRDVVEGQRPFVFVGLFAGNLPAQDLREHVVPVVSLVGIDRHQAFLAAFSFSPDNPSRRSSSARTSASGTCFSASNTSRWKTRSAASAVSSSRLPANAAVTA